MTLWEKIKMWFTSVTQIVNFLIKTYTEGVVLADKKANFKTWVDYILAVLQDALDYAEMIENLVKGEPKAVAASVGTKAASISEKPKFRTSVFKEKAKKL